ncbi:hypothetical protein Mapa_009609 [Marchantia paleacea]|nr:hypothetical protein Mapa_009609 [Marchantia paleacea]
MATSVKQWHGKGSVKLEVPVEKVWALAGDMANIYKWDTELMKSSEILEGEANTVGSVRKITFVAGEQDVTLIDKVVAYDAEKYTYSYEIIQDPWGYSNTSGSLKFEATDDGSTLASWEVKTDPVPSMAADSLEEALAKIQAPLKHMILQLGKTAAST